MVIFTKCFLRRFENDELVTIRNIEIIDDEILKKQKEKIYKLYLFICSTCLQKLNNMLQIVLMAIETSHRSAYSRFF